MPSLEQKQLSNNYLISAQNYFSFKFDERELDSIIKAALAIKKNIVYLKSENAEFNIKNEECLENNDHFLFIPHRLKKQFKSIQEYIK